LYPNHQVHLEKQIVISDLCKKKHMSKEREMRKYYADYLKSGQSKNEFSRDKGINVHTFRYWERKIIGTKEPVATNFVEILKEPISGTKSVIELEYPNGVKLRIGHDYEAIRSLISLF
jgi:hypothetical protein